MTQETLTEDMKELVLMRFKTLNPDAKITMGGGTVVTVKEIIHHITEDDEFGRRAVQAQMRMLRVLAGGA